MDGWMDGWVDGCNFKRCVMWHEFPGLGKVLVVLLWGKPHGTPTVVRRLAFIGTGSHAWSLGPS